jgi:predicted  nucleic acid-binding Zn-ribbon protein
MAINAETIGTLIRLSRIDQSRRELSDRIAAFPGRYRRVAAAREKVKGDRTRLDHDLTEARKERRAREQEALTLETRIGEDAAKLNAIRSNTEYQVILRQIAEAKTRKTTLENQAIELMEREDEIGQRLATDSGKSEQELKELAGEEAQLHAEEERLLAELGARDRERVERLQEVDPELRGRYERLARSQHGLAVVPVVKGACGGCFASLPPQRVNEVRQQARLVTCDACSRILVWDEEIFGQ